MRLLLTQRHKKSLPVLLKVFCDSCQLLTQGRVLPVKQPALKLTSKDKCGSTCIETTTASLWLMCARSLYYSSLACVQYSYSIEAICAMYPSNKRSQRSTTSLQRLSWSCTFDSMKQINTQHRGVQNRQSLGVNPTATGYALC